MHLRTPQGLKSDPETASAPLGDAKRSQSKRMTPEISRHIPALLSLSAGGGGLMDAAVTSRRHHSPTDAQQPYQSEPAMDSRLKPVAVCFHGDGGKRVWQGDEIRMFCPSDTNWRAGPTCGSVPEGYHICAHVVDHLIDPPPIVSLH